MKKKLLTVLLFFGLTAVSVGTFTSCKDTEEELRVEIAGNRAALEALLKQCQTNCQAEWTRLDGLISALDQKVEGKLWTEDQLKQLIAAQTNQYALQSALEALETSLSTLKNQFTAQEVVDLHALIGQLKNVEYISTIKTTLYGEGGSADDVKGGLVKEVSDLSGKVTTLEGQVETLEGWFKDFVDEEGNPMTPAKFQEYVRQGAWVAANSAALDKVLEKKAEIDMLDKDALQDLNVYHTKLVDMYNTLFPEGITEGEDWWSYSEVIENIKANAEEIEKLHADIDKLIDYVNQRFDEMVSGLVLQTTYNPVFGAFNTPFGLNSMTLVTYYGVKTSSNTQFPSYISGEDQRLDAASFDAIDWAAMMKAGAETVSLDKDFIVDTDDENKVSLGNLWFTVNPAPVNELSGKFALVNSAEEVSPVELLWAKDDTTVLKFGYSRAVGNGNGLYQAEAKVAADELDNIKIRIEPGLVEALKDAVKQHTAADMAHMAKVVYNQLSNVCDANALRYTYDQVIDTAGNTRETNVYSNYGLAATSFKPLGFTTLKGVSLGHIPTIDHITIDKSLVKLDFSEFKLDDVTLDVDLDIKGLVINDYGDVVATVRIPNKYVVSADGTEATLPEGWNEDGSGLYDEVEVNLTEEDLSGLIGSIQNSVNKWIEEDLKVQVNEAIKNAVDKAFNGEDGIVKKIQNQVNDMTGTIQDKLYDLVNKINNDYLGKVNRLVDLYNRVANRINNVLQNPNHYLQTAIFYKTSKDLGVLSTNPKQPTQFKGNGEAIELFISTYNFEVVAPVYKKFIGVTKVTKNGVEMPELAKAANESANFGEVLNGDVNRVALNVKGATNGTYLYEVAYQAVDYMGYTSTVKAYIQVVR